MKRIVTILVSALITYEVCALPVEQAEATLKETVNKVLAALRDSSINSVERRDKLVSVFDNAFDFKLMAMLSLGRRQWLAASKDQQALYVEYFVANLKRSYIEKLELYSDEKVIFEPAVKVKRRLKIPTQLISSGETIDMVYKMHNSNGRWLIYDVEIQGISLIVTYNSQYTQALKSGTFDELLESIKPEANAEESPPES